MIDQPRLNRKPVAPVGDLVTPTGVALVWYGLRLQKETSAFYAPDLELIVCNPHWLGYVLQVHIVLIGLFLIPNHTRLFRPVIGAELAPDDQVKLLGALIGIQLITLGYGNLLSHFPPQSAVGERPPHPDDSADTDIIPHLRIVLHPSGDEEERKPTCSPTISAKCPLLFWC